jgi:hypothetical protein
MRQASALFAVGEREDGADVVAGLAEPEARGAAGEDATADAAEGGLGSREAEPAEAAPLAELVGETGA